MLVFVVETGSHCGSGWLQTQIHLHVPSQYWIKSVLDLAGQRLFICEEKHCWTSELGRKHSQKPKTAFVMLSLWFFFPLWFWGLVFVVLVFLRQES